MAIWPGIVERTMTAADPAQAMCSLNAVDADDDACAICFEEGPFVSLPCNCRIQYCSGCWDRALATSVSVRGIPQCPSCRTGIHIEFNQKAERLDFSTARDEAMTRADWRICLYGKTKPVQIKLLQDLREGCAPQCLCGANLELLSGRERIIRLLEDTDPDWKTRVMEPEQCISTLSTSSLVTCDLCDENATTTGMVWTCSNGPRTVLHPAAYDICEACFNRHSSKVSDNSGAATGGSSTAGSRSGGIALEATRRMGERLKRLNPFGRQRS